MKERAEAPLGFSRWLWRIRRAFALAASHRCIARFAGGYAAAVGIAFDLMRARGLGAVLGWATTAAAHGRFLDARQYQRWAESRPRPAGGGDLLIVASTLGVDVADHDVFLGLLGDRLDRLAQNECVSCVVAADEATALRFETLRNTVPPNVAVERVSTLTLNALLDVARRRGQGSGHVALLKPGYLPGALAVPSGMDPNVLLYGDEDCMDGSGARSQPRFKPCFSPDLLLAEDYLGSLLLPPALVEALPEDAADYHSLTLRLVEMAASVVRLDAVLAHRFQGTAGMSGKARTVSTPPPHLGDFLRNRYGPNAEVIALDASPPWRCDFGNRDATVSVILPTRDRLPLLRNCVRGIFESNSGDFEVVVLDNDSTEAETLDWFEQATKEWPRLRVVPAPGPFNWSRLNNLGMAHARGDVFVFLNNDTEPRCGDWLARLADVALRPNVGAVGALLLYASGRIQHAGVVVGDGRWADHIYRGDFPSSEGHVFVPPTLPRNVSAVTGACMALSRRTVERIGAFDEGYAVAGSDVEICIRALRHGLLNVYLPDVVLLHLESQTRGRRDPAGDVARLVDLLRTECAEDPFFSPHLNAAPLYLTRRGRGRT